MIERGEEQNKRPGQTTGSPLFMFVKNGKRKEREKKTQPFIFRILKIYSFADSSSLLHQVGNAKQET